MTGALLAYDTVTFTYADTSGGPAFALHPTSLQVDGGEWVAIIGQNGSGKTTLARLSNGLLRPNQGRVLVQGSDIAGQPVAAMATRVGYAFQNPDAAIFSPTVAGDVGFGPRSLGLAAAEIDRRVGIALAALNLTELADRHPLLLSYGARRLVALAGVLALETPLLVLDEPTSGLDQAATSRLLAALAARQAVGAGIIVISHDLELVAARASRVVVIAGGRVVADGPPRAILTDAALLARAGLTPPPVTRLAQTLAAVGAAVPADALTVEELASPLVAALAGRRPE